MASWIETRDSHWKSWVKMKLPSKCLCFWTKHVKKWRWKFSVTWWRLWNGMTYIVWLQLFRSWFGPVALWLVHLPFPSIGLPGDRFVEQITKHRGLTHIHSSWRWRTNIQTHWILSFKMMVNAWHWSVCHNKSGCVGTLCKLWNAYKRSLSIRGRSFKHGTYLQLGQPSWPSFGFGWSCQNEHLKLVSVLKLWNMGHHGATSPNVRGKMSWKNPETKTVGQK